MNNKDLTYLLTCLLTYLFTYLPRTQTVETSEICEPDRYMGELSMSLSVMMLHIINISVLSWFSFRQLEAIQAMHLVSLSKNMSVFSASSLPRSIQILKMVRADEKCSSNTFIEVEICHRMGTLRMLYSMTLTYIFKVKLFKRLF